MNDTHDGTDMRWVRRVLIAFSVFILLLGVALTILLSIDLGRFKGTVENYVSKATGRKFAIGGRFRPEIGKNIDLLAEDVSLANAEWGVAENMLTVERLVLSIDLWSLIDGPIRVENLEVEGLVAHVEAQADTGKSAWDFSRPVDGRSDDEEDVGFLQTGELPLLLERVRLRDIEITYGRGWLDAPRQVSVDEATLAERADGLLELALSGALGAEPLRASGRIGPLTGLITGHDLRWIMEFQSGRFQTTTEGRFRNLFTLEGPEVEAQMKGPSAEALLARLGLPPIARGPVDIAGHLRDEQGSTDARIAGRFGDLAMDVTGRAASLRELGDGSLTLDVQAPNIQAIGELFGAGFLPAGKFILRGKATSIDDVVSLESVTVGIGDARLRLDGDIGMPPDYHETHLTIEATGPEIQRFIGPALEVSGLENTMRFPPDPFEIRGAIERDESGWFVDTWTLNIGDDRLEINGSLGELKELGGIGISVKASGSDLRQFLPDRGLSRPVPYAIGGRIEFGQELIDVQNVELQVGQNSGFLDGRIPTTMQLADAKFEVRLSGPDLAYLGQTINVADLPGGPFRLDVTLSREGTAYVMDELVAELAGNDLAGNIRVEFEPRRKFFGRLESDGLDLTQLLPAGDSAEKSGENSADQAAEDQPKPDRVIPDYALPLHILDFADVDAVVRVRRLKSESYDLGDIELKALIEEDRLSVETGNVVLKHGGTMAAALELVRKSDGSADASLEVTGRRFSLRPPIDDDGNPIRRPSIDLNIELSGSGLTLRQLAASANGLISVRQGEGELDNTFKGVVLQDVVSMVFGAINPLSKDSAHTRLHCGIVEIDVVDGVARTRVAGMQTDKLAAASIGTVNLATEALDFSFRTTPRKGIGISLAGAINPFIRLGGTLADPSIKLNRKRGLLPGTILTGGLSILTRDVWDRYLSADDFCEAAIAGLESGEIGTGDGQPDERKKRFRLFRRKNRQEKNDDAGQ